MTLSTNSLGAGAMLDPSSAESASEPPAAAPPEAEVEVHHKPKPVHGWRDFLKEYAIIVLGVLTALTAEQVAEHFRWQEAVGAGREALHREMAFDDGFMRDRLLVQPCVDRNIETMTAMIETASRTGSLPKGDRTTPFPGRRLETSEWENERASQSLTHFPRDEMQVLGRYYAQIDGIRGWDDEEVRAWANLAVLDHGPKRLGEADIAQLRVSIETARRMEQLVTLNAQRVLDWSKALGVSPTPVNTDWVRARCPEAASKVAG